MKWPAPVCVLLTVCLLNLTFLPFGLFFLAWFALIPLTVLHRYRGGQRFLLGWATGSLIHAAGYFWIVSTIHDFGGLSMGLSFAGGALFWLYQGMDLGLWLMVWPWLGRKLPDWARALTAASWWFILQTYLMPFVFPWDLGAALAESPFLAAAAGFWRSYGLAFWMVFFQVFLVLQWRKPKAERRPVFALAAPALVLIAAFFGAPAKETDQTWTVVVVQPNLIPYAKREPLRGDEIFNLHYELSQGLSEHKPDLIVWPETAVPFELSNYPGYERHIYGLAQQYDCGVILGVMGRENTGEHYNEIRLYEPNEAAPQIYRKEKLVLFGEKLPWILSWAKAFMNYYGDLAAGQNNKPFTYRGKQIIPQVCFESLFPRYTAQYQGHLIVNLTNDAWYGKTKGPLLHLQHVRLRAAELGVPMVRATNSGISAWIDNRARVNQATALFEKAVGIYQVPIPRLISGSARGNGELFIRVLASIMLILGLVSNLRAKGGVASKDVKSQGAAGEI